jgi:CHAD domain-containing protein
MTAMSETEFRQLDQDSIRLRAYEIWKQRPSGSPREDWLQAERELLAETIGAEIFGTLMVAQDAGSLRLGRRLVEQRDALLAYEPGVRTGLDPEDLHKHRVAARRARAFLRATRDYVDPAWRRSIGDRLRELGESSGPVRDLDVLIEHVHEQAASLPEGERSGFEALLASLESSRQPARERLLDALRGDSYRSLLRDLGLPPRLASGVETVPLKRIARKEIRKLSRAVRRLGKRPDDAALHGLRIKLKRARYSAELAWSARKPAKRFLADARKVQGLLGEHQDAVVAEQRLREATVHDTATEAAFAAGRMAERQRARRERVTKRLPSAWKRLRKSGVKLS